ncbi:PTS system fructose-specific EIIABC component [bacterium BMS3Abin05]|nr:PTS system fructose-specific EIIABC component [bacterium BMS3Abin05]HDZ10854.1 PTS sugar transporter subunit IIA [Bacteroidota bacterium]
MEISEFVSEDLVLLDVQGKTKEEILKRVIENLVQKRVELKNPGRFYEEVLERERLGGTGIGGGVAIPHARTENVNRMIVTFSRIKEPVDFESEDRLPVRLIFLIAVPIRGLKSYLTTLAKISRMVRPEKAREMLLNAASPGEVISLIRQIETEIMG